jgi:hypothetical protein
LAGKMMSITKMASLVEKLNNLTNNGKIEWEETTKSNIFQSSFANYSIRIYGKERLDTDSNEVVIDYYLDIVNSDGKMLESINDLQLHDQIKDAYLKMKNIFEAARGYALGSEQALDNIIKELDFKEQFDM